MSAPITFSVKPRTVLGKKSKTLRQNRLVPGNVVQSHHDSTTITLDRTAFTHLYDRVGDTGLVNLSIEGESAARPVLIEVVQRDGVTAEPIHVVFRQVSLKEKIKAEIPVEIVGECDLPDTVVVTVHDKIEVEALPAELPDKFEVDVSGFSEPGQMVTFEQLSYDKSKVKLLVEEEELATPVVMLQEVKEEVEEPVAQETEAGAEGEVASEETSAETAKEPQEETTPSSQE